MASIKAIAAIALTLMIAVPIGLGYAFASEEETYTEWTSESTNNVTDLLLNSTTDYYTDYMNPLNNSVFLQTNVSQGSSTTTQIAPDYASVSSKYSSIAEYGSGSTTYSLNNVATQSITYDGTDGETHNFGTDSDAETSVTAKDYMVVSISSDYLYATHWTLLFDSDYYYLSSWISTITLTFLRDSSSTWMLYISEDSGDDEEYGSVSTWLIGTDVDASVTVKTQSYKQTTHSGSFGYDTLSGYTAKLVGTDDSVTYVTDPESGYVYLSETGLATVGGTTYTGIESIYLATGNTYVTMEYTAATGNYADPAEGWNLPTGSGTAYYNYWMNGQENHEVRMMVHFSGTNYVILGPTLTASTSQLVEIECDSGYNITVTDVTTSEETYLGVYTDLMLVITDTETTVYGIKEWPTMGIEPTTYNSATVDYTDLGDSFAYIYMADDLNGYSNEVTYRVDSAEIVAGTYPITDDLVLYWYGIYPDRSFVFTIKSVAVYGDAIRVADPDDSWSNVSYSVTDGTITVNGTVVKVKGLTFEVLKNSDDTYDTYLGGVKVLENGSQAPNLDLWGVWSCTASVDFVTETTSTRQTWAPGEFAFEKQDFAACGLIVAGLCMIGLGMTGARSGAKIGVLLLICGGGGLIYLTLI